MNPRRHDLFLKKMLTLFYLNHTSYQRNQLFLCHLSFVTSNACVGSWMGNKQVTRQMTQIQVPLVLEGKSTDSMKYLAYTGTNLWVLLYSVIFYKTLNIPTVPDLQI